MQFSAEQQLVVFYYNCQQQQQQQHESIPDNRHHQSGRLQKSVAIVAARATDWVATSQLCY